MRISNLTQNSVIAQKTKIADTFLSRMTGLLNRSSFLPDEALVITRCQSIHMFFMRFAIDVVFVDRNNYVVGMVENIQPNRLSRIFWKASYAIELPVGMIKKSRTSLGDKIQIGS